MIPRRGLAMPMVIAVILVMTLVFFGLWKMMRGVGTQREYADAHLRALTIAESVHNLLVARLMSTPWEQRWFAKLPGGVDAQSGLRLDGGYYDYFIQDAPNQDKTVDIWVRADYKNSKRLHFYRIRYEELLFKNLTNPVPAYAGSLEDTAVPPLPSTISPLAQKMSELIAQRDRNRVAMTRKWEELAKTLNPLQILQSLGAHTGDDVLDKSISAKGVPTDPPPPQAKTPPAAQPFLDKIEKPDTLATWFAESVLLPDTYIKDKIMPLISEINQAINTLYNREQHLLAERIYREFLNYIFSIRVGVNTAELELKLNYYRELSIAATKFRGAELEAEWRKLKVKYETLQSGLPAVPSP
jgi:hypothetical protein